MNSVQVLGNLTRDPQIRVTKTGRTVASFSVAVNRSYTTPQGETRELTDFINVVAWGGLAEAVGNQLKKGTRVFVEGRYSTRNYEAQDGSRRYATEVAANLIALPLTTKKPIPQPDAFSQFGIAEPDEQPSEQHKQAEYDMENIPF